MNEATRQIMAAKGQSNVPGELIQSMLATELLQPSPELWIVSPWITNINVIDNSGRRFGYLDSRWEQGPVTLAKYLNTFIERDKKFIAVMNEDSHNLAFIGALEALGLAEHPNVTLIKTPSIHAKGIVTHHFSLTGSMNITYSGVNLNAERIVYTTDQSQVHETLAQFNSYLGATVDH